MDIKFGIFLGLSIALPMLFVPALFIFPNIVLLFIFVFIEGICVHSAKAIKKQRGYNAADTSTLKKRENIYYCPHCGSHDIKIYREGYNYNKGFWLRAFGVKGGGYVAGMNSNRARCRCMNCGYDWATDYDYRLIDKK